MRTLSAASTCAVAVGMMVALGACRLRRVTDESSDAGAADASAAPDLASSSAEAPVAPTAEVVAPPEPIPEGAAVLAVAAAPNNDRNIELLALALSQVGGDRLNEGRELDAVTVALSSLEVSGELPAGLGAPRRSDDHSVGRDAAVMAYEGRFGAVLATERLAQPSLVAEAAAAFPPQVFSSVGANWLAQQRGLPLMPSMSLLGEPREREAADNDGAPLGATSAVVSVDAGTASSAGDVGVAPELDAGVGGGPDGAPPTSEVSNSESAMMDGVAVVLRAGPGRFAAGISAGGQSTWPAGRITAVATVGAHIYAAKFGAVAIVGADDLLAGRALAREVYDRMIVTRNPNEAVRWGLAEINLDVDAGILAVDARRTAFASRPELAWLERTDRDDVPTEVAPPNVAFPPAQPPTTVPSSASAPSAKPSAPVASTKPPLAPSPSADKSVPTVERAP